MIKSLIAGLLIMISSNAFANNITTLYTYECNPDGKIDISGFTPETIFLAREASDFIIINRADSLDLDFKSNELDNDSYNDLHHFAGELASIPLNNAKITLGYGIPQGTGSGSIFLDYKGTAYAYSCSLDWSPF